MTHKDEDVIMKHIPHTLIFFFIYLKRRIVIISDGSNGPEAPELAGGMRFFLLCWLLLAPVIETVDTARTLFSVSGYESIESS